MAENDSEKTEHRSQKKLEQSRDKGELPRSQELGTFIVFSIFLTYFGMTRLAWFDGLGAIVADLLQFDRHLGITRESLGEFLLIPVAKVILLVAPLFILIMAISPLVTLVQTGFNIAKEKLQLDWNRMDPVSGVKRMVSLRQWIEGLKSCVKIGLFAYLAWSTLIAALPRLAVMGGQDLRAQVAGMLDLALQIGIRIAVLMAVLAVLDYGYQWWEFNKRLLLTHQELKDEMKEREGNPLIKQRQRQLQMERARRRMMSEVPKASVVVTNPTHYAVALAYDRGTHAAPRVVAKGTELMALRIREVAREHKITIIENKPLARSLYAKVRLGQTIPAEFYKAVAEVLAFVYLLKRRRRGEPMPRNPRAGTVRVD